MFIYYLSYLELSVSMLIHMVSVYSLLILFATVHTHTHTYIHINAHLYEHIHAHNHTLEHMSVQHINVHIEKHAHSIYLPAYIWIV